jgi:hypothetical protein
MITLPHHLHFALRANGLTSRITAEGGRTFDPVPVIKLFNPVGAATWVATELDEDDDTLFGLADLGFHCPELGSFSLREIASVRLPFGLAIERDLDFSGLAPLSVWADTARRAGSIIIAETELRRVANGADGIELPPKCG